MKTSEDKMYGPIRAALDHVEQEHIYTVQGANSLAEELTTALTEAGWSLVSAEGASDEQIDKMVARHWVATPGEFREALKEAFELRVRD